MDKVLPKTSKGIAMIKIPANFVPRRLLTTIYQAFIRRYLDYAYTLYDQPYNANFCHKIESVHY